MLFRKPNILIALTPLLITLSSTSVGADPVPPAALAEAQLRAINHRFVNAFASSDYEFIEALTSDDFFMIGNNGDWVTRTQHLSSMKKPTVSSGLSYDDVRVRLYGSVALVHGLFEAITSNGSPRRVRYTDVYHWNGARWLLISAQNTPLRDGIAKYLHRGSAPKPPKFARVDPVGTDEEMLKELNESYVRAFREADIGWYDAHLTEDYVVIGGDGSFNDRAKAIENFSRPVFATSMRSFPVSDVKIRRFDNVALIHAENSYEMKDGKKGVSRYTDIWHKEADGRWKCIAAHITVSKAPS